jgi:D-alanine-D-alanine ligase
MLRLSDEKFRRLTEQLAVGMTAASATLGIVVVANVKTRTSVTSDYQGQSVSTEFFSDSEMQQLLTELGSADIFVTPFYDEREFMSWVLAGGHRHLPVERVLVYNAAQNGTGPGRKSLIPAFCGNHGIPTTGSNAYVVSLCRHKFHLNRLLNSCGISVPRSWWYLGKGQWALDQRPPLDHRVIVKLTYESASLGLEDDSVGKWNHALQERAEALTVNFQQPVVVQEFIAGMEVECPVVINGNERWSDPVRIVAQDAAEFLTYGMVYDDQYDFGSIDSSSVDGEHLRSEAIKIAQLVGFNGIGRVDFRIDQEGRPFVIDIATNPHLVEHSSVAFSLDRVASASLPFQLLVALKMKETGWIHEPDQK